MFSFTAHYTDTYAVVRLTDDSIRTHHKRTHNTRVFMLSEKNICVVHVCHNINRHNIYHTCIMDDNII